MKKIWMILAVVTVSGIASAQVIMDADNLNGDFEDGWGTGQRSFNGTGGVTDWYNAGTGYDQTKACANNNLAVAPASNYNATVSDEPDPGTGGVRLHSVNTGQSIELGDTYIISFDWLDAYDWHTNDQVRVSVVAYDTDALSGTEVYRDWVSASDEVIDGNWASVTGQTAFVSSDAVGHTLYIQVYGVQGGGSGDGNARVDNIVVTRTNSLVVMDGDNVNGDFEDGWGSGARDFDNTGAVANWYNAGTGNQTLTCANNNLAVAPASNYNATISDKTDPGTEDARLHSAKTDATIQPGSYFEISFDWLDAYQWTANDEVRVAAVAYDTDSIGGTEVWRAWVSDTKALDGTWTSVTGQTAHASMAAAGRRLFIQVYGVDGGGGADGNARVDNIQVIQKSGLVIMDGDNYNGDFEDGYGAVETREFGSVPSGVTYWRNEGTGDQSQSCVKNNFVAAPASGYNALIGDDPDPGTGGVRLHSVETDNVINSGDRFEISFDWRDAYDWNANDQMRVAVVAYEGDDASSNEVWRGWVSDKDALLAADWTSVTGQTASASAAANGRKLFIQAYGVQGGGSGGGNARVDNITVTWIPDLEPPTNPVLSAVAGDANVYVAWDGSDTYDVYRSTTSGSYGSPIATNLTATEYLDTGVVNGTPYYYAVVAVDGLGRESGLSNEESVIPLAYPLHSAKKGAGQAIVNRPYELTKERIEKLHADWYYSWSMTPNFNVNSGIEYVPMRHGKYWPNLDELGNIGTFSHVLAWNEPYQATVPAWEQVTVSNAVYDGMYQDIVDAATNYGGSSVQIGSPSFVDPLNSNAYWQADFMPLATVSNLQVDFVTCHTYPNPSNLAVGVKSTVDGLYAEFGLPVWVTEFNGADWPDDTNTYALADTYTEMIELLYYFETTAYVERYAIFAFDDTYVAGNASQVFEIEVDGGVTNSTATLTPLGKLYAEYRSIDIGGPFADTWYYLHNQGSQKRLMQAATPGMTTIYTEGKEVCFGIVDAGGGNVFLVNRNSGERLGYSSSESAFYWSTTASGAYTQWTLSDAGNGWKYITHVGTGKRLSGDALGVVSGATDDDSVRWAFVRAYPLATDIDNDDLTDDSEIEQFGSLATSAGGTDNYDSDPYTDAEELIAGTSATNSGSYFQMGLSDADVGMLDVSFDGVAGRTYQLETTEDLIGGSWTAVTNIGPVATDGPQMLHYDASGDPTNLYGRVRILLETP